MTIVEIITLLIFLFPLAFSPGPGNMFFAACGARLGFKKTLTANFSYHLATLVVTFIIGLGFNLLILFIEDQYQYIRILGSLYLFYLSYKFYKAGAYSGNKTDLKCTFTDGVALLVFNPKAYVIIALMFSIFLNGEQNISRLILITLIFTTNNCVSFTLWTIFGDLIGSKFRNKKHAKILNNVFSLLLVFVALWMFTIEIA